MRPEVALALTAAVPVLGRKRGGRIGGKHIHAIQPFSEETGWHWHNMNAHFVYALKGGIRFRSTAQTKRSPSSPALV